MRELHVFTEVCFGDCWLLVMDHRQDQPVTHTLSKEGVCSILKSQQNLNDADDCVSVCVNHFSSVQQAI